jgi:hypothetical protein
MQILWHKKRTSIFLRMSFLRSAVTGFKRSAVPIYRDSHFDALRIQRRKADSLLNRLFLRSAVIPMLGTPLRCTS